VPLKQFKSNELKIVYYENLCAQPEIELTGILDAIGYKYESTLVNMYDQPSQTTRAASAVATGTDKIGNWKKRLSRSQIDTVLNVVQAFGLGHLYGDSTFPLSKNA
jgi:hypothetical protein